MAASIKQHLEWASGFLRAIDCDTRLDSEILLAFCLNKDRSHLLTWPEQELTARQSQSFQDLIKKRFQRKPVAYLTGMKEFYSLELITTEATLVPRPETEMLVDAALELTRNMPTARILELGTGTGAIALAIKQHLPSCRITATDISHKALHIARANAQKHRIGIHFITSDWYQTLKRGELFDIIISNPPYIAENDPCLQLGDLPAEPVQALIGGENGLDAIQEIIAGANEWLNQPGWLILEHGYEQSEGVSKLLKSQGFKKINSHPDLNNLPRMTIARRKGKA